MVGQKLIDLRRAEATLRLQHQADRGRRRGIQTIQAVLNHMDGLMGQDVQLKLWLFAQPLRQTEAIHAHVVCSSLSSRATTLEAINDDTKLLKPIDQPIRPRRKRNRSGRKRPGNPQGNDKQQAETQKQDTLDAARAYASARIRGIRPM